ncbi:hypothetical protein SAMN04487983_101170 [Streptomyces sp. yr375]|nr:hypothetical protein SAMN04487983_101170 [Streptomyces sp. yr375]
MRDGDVVVIAAGADYPEPARFTGTTTAEMMKSLSGHQDRVAAAEHVLVVVGGPSGVELSAEIRLAGRTPASPSPTRGRRCCTPPAASGPGAGRWPG